MALDLYTFHSYVKARLYYLLRCTVSQHNRAALKKSLASLRMRFGKFYELLYGKYTAKEIIEELDTKIKADFDILMVHSSYDRLLPMYSGSPQDLVNELIAYCGNTRTLVMPAFCLGGRSYNSKEYFRTHTFDVRRTLSEMGLLTEIFRRTPGVKRSLHPTHSICAVGPLADKLTASHHLGSTRTGKGTPFDIMAQNRTIIFGLGVEYFRCLAQTHAAEDMLGNDFPIKFQKETFPVRLVDYEGKEIIYNLIILKSSRTLDNTLLRSLLSKDELIEWRFRGTSLFITFAHTVTASLKAAAAKGITVYGTPN